MEWKLAEAKNRLSEVVTQALTVEPQRITRRGEVVVVLAEAEHLRLKSEKPSLVDYIINGPDISELDLMRDRSPSRDFDW